MNKVDRTALVTAFIRVFEEATGHPATAKIEMDVVIDTKDRFNRLDALLRVQSFGGELHIAVNVMKTAFPRDMRQAVWILEQYRRAKGNDDCILMVIAQYLSPGARSVLREHGVGYYEASGSLYLRYGSSVMDIQRKAEKRPAPHITSIFTGAREQVIHCLLNSTRWQRDEWLTGSEIAELAQTSGFTVSQTLSELERLEWVASQGGGRSFRRQVIRPGNLLDAWADVWRTRKFQRTSWYLYTARPELLPLAITEKLNAEGLEDWALTGAAAANMLAPLLTSVQTADLIVPPGMTSRYVAALCLEPADTGINVRITEADGAAPLFRELHSESQISVASPFIQYLDLQDGRGRNKELAAHLREIVLKI